MATKKTKKQQRIDAEKSALADRLLDMLAGAAHGHSLQDDGEDDILVPASIGMEEMAGWMRAARNYLDFALDTERWPGSWTEAQVKERAFHLDNLNHFDTLKRATDHLYDYGFRA